MVKTTKLKKLQEIKSLDHYTFVDLGAGDGSSLVNNEKTIGGRGLGVELDQGKVQKAQELGRNVVIGNALDLHKIPGKVDFVTCDNFLEHLRSYEDVGQVLEQSLKIAKFIYIRHPSFEDIEYLKKLELKTYWSDWLGHKSMLTIADLRRILRSLGVQTIKVVPVSLIPDSDDGSILPLRAPSDSHTYVESYGKKPSPKIVFDRPVYYAFDIVATAPGAEGVLPKLLYKDRLGQAARPKFVFEKQEKNAGFISYLAGKVRKLRNSSIVP